jgi:hypothetical protein
MITNVVKIAHSRKLWRGGFIVLVEFSMPVPDQAMSNIDHACGQY